MLEALKRPEQGHVAKEQVRKQMTQYAETKDNAPLEMLQGRTSVTVQAM